MRIGMIVILLMALLVRLICASYAKYENETAKKIIEEKEYLLLDRSSEGNFAEQVLTSEEKDGMNKMPQINIGKIIIAKMGEQ